MHLVEILSLRSVPAAGVALALTRRCPLHCAHCSTNSTLTSEEGSAEMFKRFVGTFTAENRPDILAVSGGEAFLRPRLLLELAEIAARVGCRTSSLSGMFWATGGRIPPAVKRAIDALDHFSVSLDVFHEREVRRTDVYAVLETLLSERKDVSVHLVGLNESDPYLAERSEEIRSIFDDRVPILVNDVSSFGRARDWLEGRPSYSTPGFEADPCTLAAWPLVAFDGTIVACANEDVVDGPAPRHLRYGHAATDTWAEVRDRCLTSSMVRAIRTFGPQYLAARYASPAGACDGYCATCQHFEHDPEIAGRVEELMSARGSAVLEEFALSMQRAAGGASFAGRYGLARFADLVRLGAGV